MKHDMTSPTLTGKNSIGVEEKEILTISLYPCGIIPSSWRHTAGRARKGVKKVGRV